MLEWIKKAYILALKYNTDLDKIYIYVGSDDSVMSYKSTKKYKLNVQKYIDRLAKKCPNG